MAERKPTTQAEKAASKANSRKTESKPEETQEQLVLKANTSLPARYICAVVSLGLFILFLVIVFKPDGALLTFVHQMVMGLVGKAAFYISVPALLILSFILAFSGRRPVIMRSICLGCFVLCCGCIGHLATPMPEMADGIGYIGDLYTQGASGVGGGVLCGGIAELLRWLCGSIIPYIILVVAAVLTLLAAFRITVIGVIRAVQNLPKEEEPEEKPEEPSEKLVNTIAKRQKQAKQRRAQAAQAAQTSKTEQPAQARLPKPESGKAKAASAAQDDDGRISDMMRQIAGDPDEPVAAAGKPVTATPDDDDIAEPAVKPEKKRPVRKEPPVKQPEPEEGRPVRLPEPEEVPFEEEPEEDEIDILSREPEKAAAVKVDAPVVEIAEEITKQAKVTSKEAAESAVLVAQEIAQNAAEEKPIYCFPPIDLLKRPAGSAADGTDEMRENSERLNETLESFKIEAHIVNVTRGPSVTRYEVELEKGVRLNKLTSAADDIALSLGASGVRIAAVPGKISVVGIEVPNRAVTTVTLREVVSSPEFNRAKSKSSFAVGKDIGGSCIVGNIAKLPHMLIAGTTGSGKSVCMNTIIISLLFKASPDDVKLIMVDPKMVELGIYNGIPHLLIPVVTDPKKAAGSLQWAVTEMMRRYKIMSEAGVRDLESYNSIVESQETDGGKLPQVVVIIDELADLMLVAAKEVEESICRIAQMGRAAGIHLIIATQRPSADVITGLMKANIPSRIAFAVASAMESRIILDTQGAEKLVGKGDMLYAPIGSGKPLRVQGCFVDDSEVERVATYVKEHYTTSYDQQVMEEIEKKAVQTGGKPAAAEPEPNEAELDGDEMLPAAVDVILETGQASVSMLQRRLKLGYARAARIVDEMEEKGIVGPFMGSKPRAILITKEQWASVRSGENTQMGFDNLEDADEAVPEEID